jgi:hypothetical protein
MDMKNINVFRRLDELETANLHLQVMLKSVRQELEALRSGVTILHNAIRRPVVTPAAVKPKPKAVKTKDALESTRAKKAAYARTYYAKKRAAAAKAAA